MAKKSEDTTVKVVLSCVYSGHPDNLGPGDVLDTDAEEAARLIGLGVATAYEPPAEAPAEPAAE